MATVKTYYFSPTGGTFQVAKYLTETIGQLLHAEVEYHSYTLPKEREALPYFDAEDIILWVTPVYAGRVPNKTIDYVRQAIRANGNPSVAVVTFGNRAYDDALAELVGFMQDGGMNPVGAAAVVTRHAFSDTLGAGRPDREDLASIDRFAAAVAEKIITNDCSVLKVPGEAHPERYYTPLKTNNVPAGFLKARPFCNPNSCTRCGRCSDVCPMGNIAVKDGIPSFDGICIKCQACSRICPTETIAFTDPDYLSHVAMIERTFAEPKRAEFYY